MVSLDRANHHTRDAHLTISTTSDKEPDAADLPQRELPLDPYGNPLTGQVPDNSAGEHDNAWLGQHQRGLEHPNGLAPVIEMGARQYSPLLGRFLEVDPIEGGSCNDYDYVCGDPINSIDLDGRADNKAKIKKQIKGLQKQLKKHREKLADFRRTHDRSQVNVDRIKKLQKEIRGQKREIDRLKNKLHAIEAQEAADRINSMPGPPPTIDIKIYNNTYGGAGIGAAEVGAVLATAVLFGLLLLPS